MPVNVFIMVFSQFVNNCRQALKVVFLGVEIADAVVDEMSNNDHNYCNITATLSTLWGVAQPWRFFFACKKSSGRSK